MKGMILAAGIGSRLRPITNKIPKVLLTVHGRPLLDYAIKYLYKYDISSIIINVHHHAHQIIDYVRNQSYEGVHIAFSDETGLLMNTGGGVKKASWFFRDQPYFVLMASDIITDLNLTTVAQTHQQTGAAATLAVKTRETSRSLLFDGNDILCGWRDNRTGQIKYVNGKSGYQYDAGFSGIHVISTSLLHKMPDGPFSITDFYLQIADNQKIKAFRHDKDTWLEFGRIAKIKQIEQSGMVKQIVDW